MLHGSLFRNLSCLIQVQNGLVHGNHAFRTAGRDGHVNLVAFVFADHIPDSTVHMHDFEGRNQIPICSRQKLLGYDGPQYGTELDTNLILLIGVHL